MRIFLYITLCLGLLAASFAARGQNVQWVQHYDDVNNDFSFVDIREQPNGDIVVAGQYSEIIFQGVTYLSNGYTYGFLACYGADGTEKWIRIMDGDNYGDAYPENMDTDADGNIYVTARGETFIYDGNTLMFEDGGYLLFKTDPDGNLLWSDTQYTESSLDARSTSYIDLYDLAVSDDGELYVISLFYGATYQHASGAVFTNDYSYVELLLIAYNADGSIKWLREGDSGVDFSGEDLKLLWHTDGSLTLGGTYNYDVTTYSLSFGGDPLPENQLDDGVFVARFDSGGNQVWLKGFNDNGVPQDPTYLEKNEELFDLSVEGDRVNMTIGFGKELLLDENTITNQSDIQNERDFALVQLDGNGNVNWYRHFTGLDLRMNVASYEATGEIGVLGLYEELDFVDSDEYLYDGRAVSDYFIARFDRGGTLISLDTTEYESISDRISFRDYQYSPVTYLSDGSLATGFKFGGSAPVSIGDFTFQEAGMAIAKVNAEEVIYLNVDLGPDILTCEGTPVVLDAGAADAYFWSTGATTRTISVSTSGNYSVTVYDRDGNSGFDEVDVTFDSPIVYQLPSRISGFSSVVITVEADAFSYLWTTGETTPSIRVSESGTVGLTLFTEGGCETYTETTVDVTPLNIYAGGSGAGYGTAAYNASVFLFAGGSGTGYSSDATASATFAFGGGQGLGYGVDGMPLNTFLIGGGSGEGYGSDSTYTRPFLFTGGSGKGYDVIFYENMDEILSDNRDKFEKLRPVLFPNPAVNSFSVKVETLQGQVNMVFYNMKGELVMKLNNTELNQSIDVSQLRPGMYIIEVEPLNMAVKGVSRTKLIVNR